MPIAATNIQKVNSNNNELNKKIYPEMASPSKSPMLSAECLEQQPSIHNYSKEWMGPKILVENSEYKNFNKKSGLVMQICTQTWLADSHGLFDYENRTTVSHEFKCTCKYASYQINRNGTEITFSPTEEAVATCESDVSTQPIAQIVWGDGYYYLTTPSNVAKPEPLWLVVRNFKCRPVVVGAGDVLKFGRFKLKIKEIVTNQQEATHKQFNYSSDDDECETVAPEPGDNLEASNISGSELDNGRNDEKSSCTDNTKPIIDNVSSSLEIPSGTRICRICLCESEDIDHNTMEYNPLVAPCECNGSMKWVHLQCLRTWIAGRLNIKSDSVAFFWKFLSCELCKLTYPTMIDAPVIKSSESMKIQYTLIQLFEIPKPLVPYTILELKSQQNKGYYIVSLTNNKIARLGRGHESDIRLADISVSRLHSILRFETAANLSRQTHSLIGSEGFGTSEEKKYQHGCFVLEDNRSKFGTLVKLKQPLKLDLNHLPISVQVGRTVITVSLKRKWRIRFPTCIRNNTSDIYSVFRQSNNRYRHETTNIAGAESSQEFMLESQSNLNLPADEAVQANLAQQQQQQQYNINSQHSLTINNSQINNISENLHFMNDASITDVPSQNMELPH